MTLDTKALRERFDLPGGPLAHGDHCREAMPALSLALDEVDRLSVQLADARRSALLEAAEHIKPWVTNSTVDSIRSLADEVKP